MSRRTIRTLLCMAMLVVATVAEAMAGESAADYSFAPPALVDAGGGFTHVEIEGAMPFSRVGQPVVPSRIARILLPHEAVVESITASPLAPEKTIKANSSIAFGRTPMPMSGPTPAAALSDAPDTAIYGSDIPYPVSRAQLVSVQRLHGFQIAIVRVFPVQVIPSRNELVFSPEIRISVEYSEPQYRMAVASVPGPPPRRRLEDVIAFVDNPDAVEAVEDFARAPTTMETAKETRIATSFDYLLVTSAALTNAFRPLVERKIADGLAVKVATMSEVLASFPGVDDAAKLRAYIDYAYRAWGIEYVLLGGDVSVVPYRGAYGRSSGYTDSGIPCDLYFACLDGSWNSDGDSLWGEPTDGEGGGDVDMLAEVYVGRAPVETPAEAAAFVAKTIAYETTPHRNVDDALFVAEYLGLYGTIQCQGGDGLDPALPAFSRYDVRWLDDRPSTAATWGTAQAVAELNMSPHIVAHNGHAHHTYALRMSNYAIAGLTNASPFLLSSIGCHSGAFDYADCYGEAIVKRPGSGAFAVVMNSRYGWFSIVNEAMYSGQFMTQFFNELLAPERPSIGKAQQRSKHNMLGWVEVSSYDMAYRWCYFGLNLLGDPHTVVQAGDDMQVYPKTGAASTGYEGAAFTPMEHVFALTNRSAAAIGWALAEKPEWLSATPSAGTVQPGAGMDVSVSLLPLARSLPQGAHVGMLVFSNTVSGGVRTRSAFLTVQPPPGEIAVVDSIQPSDDLSIDLGNVILGLRSSAEVSVSNAHPSNVLVLHGVALAGDPPPAGIDYEFDAQPAFPLQLQPGTAIKLNFSFHPQSVGVHTAAVVIASNDYDEPGVLIAVSATCIPDYLSVSPDEGIVLSGHPGGPFTPAASSFTVSNTSATAIAWSVAHPDWVYVAPSSGALASGSSQAVAVSPNPAASAMPEGLYPDSLAFSNATTSVVHPIPLYLEVYTSPVMTVTPAALHITNLMGHSSSSKIHVSNEAGADAELAFSIAPLSEPAMWLGVDSSTVNGIAPGGATSIVVSASAGMLPHGTYTGRLEIASNARTASSASIQVAMVIPGDDLSIAEQGDFISEGFTGGPFAPSGGTYILTNSGASTIGWTVSADVPWLAAAPTSGQLAPGADAAVYMSLTSASDALEGGDYTGTVAFSNAASSAVQFRKVALSVKERMLNHFEWGGIAAQQHVGEPFMATIRAVDNAGDTFPAFNGSVSLFATNGTITAVDPFDGTNAWRHPLCTYYHDARTQVIYLRDELGGPSLITGLSLNVGYRPGTMKAWTIRLKHTQLEGYSSAARNWETNGWTTVLQTNTTITTLGWATFRFSTPFVYNGTDNLLVDFSFNNASYAQDGYCFVSGVTANRSLYYHTDSAYGDPLEWSGTRPSGSITTNVPNILLDIQGLIPFSPTTSGIFGNGLWNGILAGHEEARGVRVIAADGAGHSGISPAFDILYHIVALSEALDSTAAVWAAGGDSNWWGQTAISHDGVDAARSGKIGHRQESLLETQVSGSGSVLFWWRVSSEAGWDWLELYVDGALNDRISGETVWMPKSLSLGPGVHTLLWRYVKDAADLDPIGRDCGWVDRFIGPSTSTLPLLWLFDHGLATDGSADDEDADGDRLANWEEWVAGTLPTNSASVLQVEDAVPLPDGSGTLVRWQSVAGRRYWLESTDSLSPSAVFTTIATEIDGQAGSTQFLDTRPPSPSTRFYRVGVYRE